ncbi:MAG: hypothetical protein IKG18_14510 [Atopobiaceae bacterium]|nr:hypothetical protein [Atopobiaceae bacterium]
MSQTATIVPTVPVHELWEATAPVTGDYARDCAKLAAAEEVAESNGGIGSSNPVLFDRRVHDAA